jgi:dienelactone hydrolase
MRFDALPKIPILLLFNDADDEFPAQCLLLFERRAEKYLDMECLAILGWLLAGYLCELSENGQVRIGRQSDQ